MFEMGKQLGGTWVFNEATGKNEYGIDVHSSMYKGLKTNLPKEIMGYPDFPIPEQESSYIPAEDMLTFFQQFAESYGILEHIRFSHYVVRVKPTIDEKGWEVIVRDCPNDQLLTLTFDYVLVCNGHYHTPNLPKYPGMSVFRGKQMHSHDYRSNEPFEGITKKRVQRLKIVHSKFYILQVKQFSLSERARQEWIWHTRSLRKRSVLL